MVGTQHKPGHPPFVTFAEAHELLLDFSHIRLPWLVQMQVLGIAGEPISTSCSVMSLTGVLSRSLGPTFDTEPIADHQAAQRRPKGHLGHQWCNGTG